MKFDLKIFRVSDGYTDSFNLNNLLFPILALRCDYYQTIFLCISNFNSFVGWNNMKLSTSFRGVRSLQKRTVSGYDTKLYMIMRLLLWMSEECCWLVGWVLWHINHRRLFNANSIFIKIVLFKTIQFSISTKFKFKYILIVKNISISSYSI